MFFRPTSHESCIHGLGTKHVIVFIFFTKNVVCSWSFHYFASFFLNQKNTKYKTLGDQGDQGSNP